MSDDNLDRLQRRYRELKSQLDQLGFAIAGTISERYTMCGVGTCACRTDAARRHGPYYQYSRKVAGKTVSRHLAAEQVQQYRQWIANRRTLDEITAAIDEILAPGRRPNRSPRETSRTQDMSNSHKSEVRRQGAGG